MASEPTTDFDLAILGQLLCGVSPLPLLAVDGLQSVRYANPAFCRLLGKRSEDLVGYDLSRALSASRVMPGGDATAGAILSLFNRVYETGEAGTYAQRETQTAGARWWSLAMWPARSAVGRISCVMIQVTETTDFHRQATAVNEALAIGCVRQHELTEIAENLNRRLQMEIVEREQAEQELRRANEALKQFAFAASHDLQEPLRTITIYSELLFQTYRGQMDDQAAMFVDSITKGTTRMRDLLSDLLSYAEAGGERGEDDEQVDLNEIRERVVQTLRGAMEESGAVVTSGELPTVRGRATGFFQVFQNLIGNALKYRGERPPCIHISAEQRDREWKFTVADNGIGIDPRHHEKVFGVFKRLHGKAIPGSGIGLAICQRVVEHWGGRIWVESELGLGAAFCFTLPTPTRADP